VHSIFIINCFLYYNNIFKYFIAQPIILNCKTQFFKNKNSRGNLFGRYQIYEWKHEHRQEFGCSGDEKTTSECVGMNYGVKRRTFLIVVVICKAFKTIKLNIYY